MGQVAVFSGAERRRRWSDDQKLAIVSEAFSPGACVAEVARRRDVSTSLLYDWRRKLMAPAGEGCEPLMDFAEAVVVDEQAAGLATATPAAIIDLPRGRRVTLFASATPALVSAVMRGLR